MKLCNHPKGLRFYLGRVWYWQTFWFPKGHSFRAFKTARWF